MAAPLFIRLPLDGTNKATCIGGDAGFDASRRELLSVVAYSAKSFPVIGVVPGVDVLLTRVTPPSGISRGQLEKAVPFLLEEALAAPVEKLHFALGRMGEKNLAVGVVARKTLDDWLATLDGAGIQPRALVSDVLLLPWREKNWTILLLATEAQVRTGEESGFAVERHNLLPLLSLALKESEVGPQHIRVLDYSGDTEVEAFDFSSLNVASWSREPWRGDPLVWMARDGWPRPTINLLQGSRAVQGSWKKQWKTFRVTVWILVLWILLRGGMSFFEMNSLQKQARQLDQRIEQVFRTTFPEVGKIVHAPSQMTQRLQSLQKNAQLNAGAGFLELFTKAGMVLKSYKSITLTRVHFHDGVLDLFLKAGDLQQLDGMVQDLKMKAELTATIRKANRGDDGVDSHIRIGEK